jgi:hypothetical protein
MYRSKTMRTEQKVLLQPTGVKVWPDKIDGKEQEQPTPADPSQAWRKKQRRVTVGLPTHRMLGVGQLLSGVAGAWATGLLLFLAWWKPNWGMTGGATGLGMMVGMLYTYLYYKNVKSKQQYQQVVSSSSLHRQVPCHLATASVWHCAAAYVFSALFAGVSAQVLRAFLLVLRSALGGRHPTLRVLLYVVCTLSQQRTCGDHSLVLINGL